MATSTAASAAAALQAADKSHWIDLGNQVVSFPTFIFHLSAFSFHHFATRYFDGSAIS